MKKSTAGNTNSTQNTSILTCSQYVPSYAKSARSVEYRVFLYQEASVEDHLSIPRTDGMIFSETEAKTCAYSQCTVTKQAL